MRGMLKFYRFLLALLLCSGLGLIGLAVWQLHAGPANVELMLGKFAGGMALVHVWALGVPVVKRFEGRAVPAQR
ncbi:hypothetical protein GO986_12245 [Deinococcus sp. HMF7620]|uniref:Uncharacterized protein n=1 Tax=Deinococcus arboris TaxID=2682977 RepID=A0A7C9LNY9_9DEIO|nr:MULTISPECIES: hypothetical protein [Deinococcus]MBZ9752210.1 hypothetical protein [Deinococcus betulae]MVN87536.1 hypothetical protein [Deinococcus arboris]